ncbi:uncharacterized protein EV422DRAFT_595232 [Fimicolochytrium jonesii]|uniref:uncharacterized protein n=1 Tax=Fimicolochytrium jonesii TaxID=1396493 RepID=UPI0022FEDBC7|nr:uncharacterized protein EV422DRAFT_595232 [Fimicolochytrium jonesii]KAI8821036.1 hypothetical protein EV422DRAFT_595232 [Fimicolochytrium jonesii]
MATPLPDLVPEDYDDMDIADHIFELLFGEDDQLPLPEPLQKVVEYQYDPNANHPPRVPDAPIPSDWRIIDLTPLNLPPLTMRRGTPPLQNPAVPTFPQRSASALSACILRFKDTGSAQPNAPTGRPRKYNEDHVRRVHQAVRKNNRENLDTIQRIIEDDDGIRYPVRSLQRLIQRAELFKFKAARKPLLDARKTGLRLAWTQERLHWDDDMWKNVIFSDESSFSLYSSTRVVIWRERGDDAKYRAENLVPKVQKNGGSLAIYALRTLLVAPTIRKSPIFD